MTLKLQQPQTLLIVDDNPNNLQILSKLLTEQGWEILVATDGWMALEQAEYAQPDLILLDVMMPNLDGFETCRRLKANPSLQDIPVIFMTALDEIADQLKGFAVGGVDYISKPYQVEAVMARINVHLQLRSLTKALAEKNEQLNEKNAALQQEICDRQQTEAALRESEERFRVMANSAPVLLWVSDEQGQCHFFNERWLAFTGRALEQELGEGWATGVHPNDYDRCLEAYRTGLATLQPFQIEYRLRRADGEYRWVLDHGAPRFHPNGEFAGFIGSCIDISDRKVAEEAVRESQQQLAAIASNIPGGVFRFVYHADGRHSCPFVSEGYRTLFGIDPELFQVNPEIKLQMAHPDDLPIDAEAAAIAGESTSFQGEVRYILPTGEMKWISTTAQLTRLENGDVVVDGIDIDITYRKQLEADLLQREAFFNSIYNSVEIAIVVLDVEPDGTFRFVDCNPGCSRLTGINMDDLRGKPFDALSKWITQTELEAMRTRYQYGVDMGEAVQFEVEVTTPSQEQWWLNRYSPLKDETGRVYRFIITAIPITERKRAEAQLASQNGLLAQIASGEPLTTILDRLIHLVEQNLPGAIASVLMVNEDNTLQPAAAQHLPPAFVQAGTKIPIGEGQGSCGTAAFRNQTVVVSEIRRDRLWQDCWPLALQHNLQACWSVPIINKDERLLGTLAVYYREVRSPQKDELETLERMANFAGIAIERERTEDALRKSEARFRQIAETVREGFFAFELADFGYSYVNPAYETITGFSAAEIYAQSNHWIDSIHPDDRDRIKTAFQRELQGEVFDEEYRLIRPDGTLCWARSQAFPVHDASGAVIRIVGAVEDISDRKRIEEEQQRAEAQIRASLHEKEALLAEIHHRVKNNLQIISSLLNLQAYKIDDPQIRKALEDSWTRVDSMALVHETLYRSQDFSSINFAEYLENLSQNLFNTYNTQTHQIHLEIQSDREITLALNQAIPCGLILNELITNALKHAFKSDSDACTTNELSVQLTQTADHQIQLSVSNSGDTLPPNFNPSKTRSMGLQLVTNLVNQLEGTLEITRGDRTVFTITFAPDLETSEEAADLNSVGDPGV